MLDKLPAIGVQGNMLAEMQRMQLQAQTSPIAPAGQTVSLGTPSFTDVLKGAVGNVDRQQQVASQKQTAIDMGLSDDLSGAMIESQKASVAFSALMQVRNKLQQGFDEVINSPL
ncbi:flagellar hook-basal body complex protein FliE [Pantoea sp. BIGb0393]|uniref:Flagellar hook-basal body complex protein FliE n=1 Tax=Pantoea nemavictus TaxID=2726955 RepID=A0ABU8PRZ0_9GAMM|nr:MULTISPECIES: flagellar hook-basal body complex protein FliE [Pantoea]EJL87141.1 flagellar hook-basal body protein [Pantoea sp. GM01]MBA0035863.1 flagellar hook-basal body complex protein FliE [Pantoea nemavictus]